GDDYWNAPLTEAAYDALVEALRTGEQYQPHHEFDRTPYFEGCLPVEEMAARGRDVLRFGPMKPVGLGTEAFAVVQLRQEDRAGQMWNLVGFQTRLKVPEQQRVFRMIPGLEHAEFLRFGSIHRNAYINSPRALTAYLSAKDDATLLFAGQLTGVEGYTESAATGILAGINLARLLRGDVSVVPPPTTMLGAPYRQGVRARRKRLRRVLYRLLRRRVELRRGRPPGDSGLAGKHAAAWPRQALRRARSLGAADVLPVPEHDARAGAEPREGGAH